ncbi:hypothetical protein KEM56_005921 [Ascosphaera pollenicola]|nr:hypothetical protein KEM56_005921 [Ascosphaera pollenicola]
MEFLLLRPAHLAAANSRRAAIAAAAAAAAAASSRPSSLVSAQCATPATFVQRRAFRCTPSVRSAGSAGGKSEGRGREDEGIARPEADADTTEAAARPRHAQPQQSAQKHKQHKKRMRYRIAAAASGKASGVSLDRNVYPFLPQHHDAIGVQDITSDPVKRRRSRPDSGEDAFFVSKVGVGRGVDRARDDGDARREGYGSTVAATTADEGAITFGVADGVGGWANSGVDPADFSHALCTYMADSALHWREKPEKLTGRQLIQLGYEKSLNDKSLFAGGSTASLGVAWETGELELTNLGDSGSMIFRNAAIHHYSPPQTHDFNTPYQLTVMPPRARSQSAIFGGRPFDDLPNAADVTTWDLQHGDVLLLATDGVFDNLFRGELLRVVASRMFTAGAWEMDGEAGAKVATDLTKVTQPGGIDLSPFLQKEQEAQKQQVQQKQKAVGSQEEGERVENQDPLAGIEPMLRPSLQSLLALSVVVQAKVASLDMRRDGPFAKEAQRFRPAEHWSGGKVDDTTALIVVAVEEGSEL